MIAVLMGGNSAERAVSLEGGEAVYRALQNQGVDCFKFDWQADNLNQLWSKTFDKAFIILHGRGGEDGVIQQQLEQRGVPYTGSGVDASQRCMNKAISKNIWAQHGLKAYLAPSVLAHIEQDAALSGFDFDLPWAVKPILEGSSIGMSKVNQSSELKSALSKAWKYDPTALIEKWINGEEYTVAILNGKALPVVQIKVNQGFYDYQSKYHSDETEYFCPCTLTDTQQQQLQQIALKAFDIVNAKTWGRADFILDAQNTPYLLEINTVPGMTAHSLVPMAAKAVGMDFDKLVLAILNG